jgi:hypothetical protein
VERWPQKSKARSRQLWRSKCQSICTNHRSPNWYKPFFFPFPWILALPPTSYNEE